LTRLGAAFVERHDLQRSVDDARRLVDLVEQGRSLLVFPEGTFVAAPGLLPFHLGAFLAAAQAGAPVLPVTIRGTRELLPDGRWWARRAAVEVVIDAPIAAAAEGELFARAVQLRTAARSVILRRLAQP
ncbi:MAG: lysophospholipid acyltransferase family protein, partial [Rubrivivax sp.]|nr:lysophospholipid acyltransferase family protein [Rubrivivax sp.]